MGLGGQLAGSRTPWMIPADRLPLTAPVPAAGNRPCLCIWVARSELNVRERKFPSGACPVHPEALSAQPASTRAQTNHVPGAKPGWKT